MPNDGAALPPVRGRLTAGRALSDLTWLRVGGPAEWLFQPADQADLMAFLAALDPAMPVFAMGVGSNLIVRDGGLSGVVIRLGRPFADITIDGAQVTAGAAALDAQVARRAAEAGRDLTFLRTIPGSIGGALRMNAGCYGSYVADHVVSAEIVRRDGTKCTVTRDDIAFEYRQTDLPRDAIVTSVTFEAPAGDPDTLEARMAEQLAQAGCDPTHEGPQRRIDLPQPGGFFVHRPRR
jgi:UDP-N-acetylmuramate dehydrogenase